MCFFSEGEIGTCNSPVGGSALPLVTAMTAGRRLTSGFDLTFSLRLDCAPMDGVVCSNFVLPRNQQRTGFPTFLPALLSIVMGNCYSLSC